MMNAQTAGSKKPTLLDVHHHMVPPVYLRALAENGVDTGSFPEWTAEGSLRIMDRLGISV